MLRTILIVLLVVMVTVPAAAEWEMSEFVIMLGWPQHVKCPDDEAMMQAIAQAGFNVVMGTQDQLDLAHKYGLKLLLENSSINDWVLKHPANWGYYVGDEPSPEKYEWAGQQAKYYHQADPHHPAWVNLGSPGIEQGIEVFRGNVRSFVETVHPRILSFDYYEWWKGWPREWHFPVLEAYRRAALAAGIPLIRWVEVNAHVSGSAGAPRAPSNAEKLRHSVYTSLCYGVKGIEWFTGHYLFEPGTSGLRACGRDVVTLNAELQALGPILIDLKSVDVFHTPPLPEATRQLPEDYWVQTATPDLVLGMFKDSQDNDYIMVANRKIQHRRWAVLSLPQTVTEVAKFSKDEGKWIDLPLSRRGEHSVVEFIVAPGDGELLTVQRVDGGNVYIGKGAPPDLRLEQWREEVRVRKPELFEVAEGEISKDEVALSPLSAEWKFATDANDIGVSEGWLADSFSDDDWAVVRSDQGAGWESQGFPGYTGFGWYRQAFQVPDELAERKFVYLYFGAVDEEAYVYLNGQQVYEHSCASTGLAFDVIWAVPFAFDAKPYLKFGQKNTVTVRVYNRHGMGGIYLPVYLIGADRELDAELMATIIDK